MRQPKPKKVPPPPVEIGADDRDEAADALARVADDRLRGLSTFLGSMGLSPVAEEVASRAFSAASAESAGDRPAWERWCEAASMVRDGWPRDQERIRSMLENAGCLPTPPAAPLGAMTATDFGDVLAAVMAALEDVPPVTLEEALAFSSAGDSATSSFTDREAHLAPDGLPCEGDEPGPDDVASRGRNPGGEVDPLDDAVSLHDLDEDYDDGLPEMEPEEELP